jgi:hypothetical protein
LLRRHGRALTFHASLIEAHGLFGRRLAVVVKRLDSAAQPHRFALWVSVSVRRKPSGR